MNLNENQIDSIVNRVVANLSGNPPVEKPVTTPKKVASPSSGAQLFGERPGRRGCFSTIDDAVSASKRAFAELSEVPVETRKKYIQAMRDICNENIKTIARMGHEETGLGRYEDKLVKNRVAIFDTPGVEDLEPTAFTGDNGLTILERAPWGVIGSITPCTNPSETIISNSLGMLAAGNSVVFNPHPSAKKTSVYTIDLLNQAILSEGGPANLFATVDKPTIASANQLMNHSEIKLLVVTGGPAVVAAAMKTGKRVIGAGPGNPPVVVDETADIDKAARDIVRSAGTDNNIICVIEKEIIVTEKAASQLKKALIKHGAYELSSYQAKRLEGIILDGDHPNKNWVGKDIQLILKEIGLNIGTEKRIAIAETGPDHPFATVEMLLPVLPFIVVKDIDQAIEVAYKLEGGCFHTAVIHSKNIDHMHRMAKKMNTSIFVKNGMALEGLGLNGDAPASFTIASPTGEGVTSARHFTRTRRCVISGHFRIN
jgi:acyl-CoA reductase-like NAD-dependent aldehyde dehydrogenase